MIQEVAFSCYVVLLIMPQKYIIYPNMQKKRNFVAQKSIGIKDMSQKEIHLKAVLFDMDGVLFN